MSNFYRLRENAHWSSFCFCDRPKFRFVTATVEKAQNPVTLLGIKKDELVPVYHFECLLCDTACSILKNSYWTPIKYDKPSANVNQDIVEAAEFWCTVYTQGV